MLYIISAAAIGLFALGAYFARCWIVYLYDKKGFRRFQNMTALSGMTDIPWVWHSIRGQRYKALHAAHERASVIRVASNAISFNDPAAIGAVYGHGTPAIKAPWYDAGAGPFKHVGDTRDKQRHSQKRRVLANGFALTTLLRWEDKIASRLHALLDQYDRHCLSPTASPDAVSVDHRHWMDLFTVDTINDIGLSANLRLIEKGDDVFEVTNSLGQTYKCRFRESLWGGLRIHSCFAIVPKWYKLAKKLTWWDSRWKDSASFDDIVATQCKNRIERHLAGEKLDDMFACLLESKNGTPHMLMLGEMMAECSVMINAGSETTGIALSNLLYLLIRHPQCLRRLQEEVDEALRGIEGPAPFEKVRYLPYLKAYIDESLRLHPLSSTSTQRMTPPSGQQILDHWIPGNTVVFVPTYTVHRNPAVFSNPNAFDPSRWLGDNVKELQAAHIPFSTGPRACIGRNITFMEQQLMIASLVHRYDFELISPDW